MSVKLKLEEIQDHEGFGNPPNRAVLNRVVNCYSCQRRIDDGQNVFLGRRVAGLYCKDCGVPRRSSSGISGEERVASHVKVRYRESKGRGELKDKIRAEFKENGMDLPGEEQLETLVEKRLGSEERGEEKFLEEAEALSSFVN